jgi:hypothetical protein
MNDHDHDATSQNPSKEKHWLGGVVQENSKTLCLK